MENKQNNKQDKEQTLSKGSIDKLPNVESPNVIVNISPEKIQASNNEYYQTDLKAPPEDLKFGGETTLLKGDKLSYLDETKDKLRYFKIVVGNKLYYGYLSPGAEKPRAAEYCSRYEYLSNEYKLKYGEAAFERFMSVYRSRKRAEKMMELEVIRNNAKVIESKLLK